MSIYLILGYTVSLMLLWGYAVSLMIESHAIGKREQDAQRNDHESLQENNRQERVPPCSEHTN